MPRSLDLVPILALLVAPACFSEAPLTAVDDDTSTGSDTSSAASSEAATGSGSPSSTTTLPDAEASDADASSDGANSSDASTGAEDDCVAVPDGLVAWWRLDADFTDAIGDAHGVAMGEGGFADEGRVGAAALLDGIDDAVSVPATPAIAVASGGGFTLEVWVRLADLEHPASTTSTFGDFSVVSKMLATDVPNGDGWRLLELAADHRWAFCIGGADNGCNPGGATGNIVIAPEPARAGVWTHLAAVRDDDVLHLYVDGVHAAEAVVTAPVVSDGAALLIGSSSSELEGPPYNALFFGRIDEVSLYDRPLGPDEIAALATATAGKCPG